jgi:hypothetical protein
VDGSHSQVISTFILPPGTLAVHTEQRISFRADFVGRYRLFLHRAVLLCRLVVHVMKVEAATASRSLSLSSLYCKRLLIFYQCGSSLPSEGAFDRRLPTIVTRSSRSRPDMSNAEVQREPAVAGAALVVGHAAQAASLESTSATTTYRRTGRRGCASASRRPWWSGDGTIPPSLLPEERLSSAIYRMPRSICLTPVISRWMRRTTRLQA